jgi:hypothetical protein
MDLKVFKDLKVLKVLKDSKEIPDYDTEWI